jgi:hypothetical protein
MMIMKIILLLLRLLILMMTMMMMMGLLLALSSPDRWTIRTRHHWRAFSTIGCGG